MDRQLISNLAHADHPISAPVSDVNVRTLLDRAICGSSDRLLDLGCGQAEWSVRALSAHGGATAIGVDRSALALNSAGAAARRVGVADRLRLVEGDITEYRSEDKADVVLCVGAEYAFGGLLPTLTAAAGHLTDDGVLLLGVSIWEREPDAATLEVFGVPADEYADLATTVERIVEAGWTPTYGHVSTRSEWDDYEWNWTGSLARWALDNRDHPDAATALAVSADHRDGWLRGYRGVAGFVVFVLRRTSVSPVQG
ncbi:SAM-dependent methyltransferase [Actinoalloteichus hymeniacidonis]|uniref:Methyltransferase domain n=1 Tax=Actinoalloteichus hymeniacidonis TaxID=340345 RepID=A0AAC9HRG5_9PSEU|nr:class I SAM-dependent methyltransferase [Actinoalloteichus hymeniacidonis]AOS63866.1 Methyltransferase domain [Actinoalloteichus hymeniacidonis]MBB5908078.1 cyclopropane fatty-acyl-phospholipid synthase-like methyltransferase [Actinoalloteichus hymeniacidonis]